MVGAGGWALSIRASSLLLPDVTKTGERPLSTGMCTTSRLILGQRAGRSEGRRARLEGDEGVRELAGGENESR